MDHALAPDAAEEALADGVGARRPDPRPDHLDPAGRGEAVELGAVRGVVVVEEEARSAPLRRRLAQLLGRPGPVGERVTPTCTTRRELSSRMKRAKTGRKNRSVSCRKSHAQTSAEWLRRNVAHDCPDRRGGRAPCMYFWMVRLLIRMPSFSS